jgi:hypothetical protein
MVVSNPVRAYAGVTHEEEPELATGG